MNKDWYAIKRRVVLVDLPVKEGEEPLSAVMTLRAGDELDLLDWKNPPEAYTGEYKTDVYVVTSPLSGPGEYDEGEKVVVWGRNLAELERILVFMQYSLRGDRTACTTIAVLPEAAVDILTTLRVNN